jgi:hypothetical protein
MPSEEQHDKRVRRLRINVAAWVLGTILLTTLWVVNQWQDNVTEQVMVPGAKAQCPSRLAVWIRLVGDVRRRGEGPDRRRADSLLGCRPAVIGSRS